MAKMTDAQMQAEWQAEMDANALVTADEIKSDKKRMSAVKKHVKKQQKTLDKLVTVTSSKPVMQKS